MSEFRWESCYVGILGSTGLVIHKAKYHLGDKQIKCRMGLLRSPIVFAIAKDSTAIPFKKHVIFFIDSEGVAMKVDLKALPMDEETKLMLRVVGRDKWFRAMAGKTLTTWEEITRLLAGAGLVYIALELLRIVFTPSK